MTQLFQDYIQAFSRALSAVEVRDAHGRPATLDDSIITVHDWLRRIGQSTNKVMFIGNGGSAGIAGHLAIDFAKNGGVRAITFNDASSLTCLGNDLGYEQVFAKQVEMQAFSGDLLIAISSSGESKNILSAVVAAKKMNCRVITLSGFAVDNKLRAMGDINFYVPSGVYGFVETAHQAILHTILDTAMGWSTQSASTQPTARIV